MTEALQDIELSIEKGTPQEVQKQKQLGLVPQVPALFPWQTVLQIDENHYEYMRSLLAKLSFL